MTPADFADADVCRLITTGRRTGRRHDIEMWFGIDDGAAYFISGNGPGADWFRNLLAEETVEVRINGRAWIGTAREVSDPAERHRVGVVMGDKYGGWGGDASIGLTEHDWRYTVPAAAVGEWRPIS